MCRMMNILCQWDFKEQIKKIGKTVTGVLISPQPDPGRKKATATKTYGVQTTAIYCCCLYAVSLGRCSLFPSRIGLRTYQHPDTVYQRELVKVKQSRYRPGVVQRVPGI